jgi:hypothetical protein
MTRFDIAMMTVCVILTHHKSFISTYGLVDELTCLVSQRLLEVDRLEMNIGQPVSMNNYTKLGFAKARLPPVAWKMLLKFWEIVTQDGDMGVTEYPSYPGSYVLRCVCALVNSRC